MRRVKCEDCGKLYDYEDDAFCPRCGAFNQPGRQDGDLQPTVSRVDGLDEEGHQDSFLHQEVHEERHKIRMENTGREMEKQITRLRQSMARSAAQAEHQTRQEAETFQTQKAKKPKSGLSTAIPWIVILFTIFKILGAIFR